jgi:hypothetical protein
VKLLFFKIDILLIDFLQETFNSILELKDFVVAKHESIEIGQLKFSPFEGKLSAFSYIFAKDKISDLFDCRLP